jgi:hypothetical protein
MLRDILECEGEREREGETEGKSLDASGCSLGEDSDMGD